MTTQEWESASLAEASRRVPLGPPVPTQPVPVHSAPARPSMDVQPVPRAVHDRLKAGAQCLGSPHATSHDPMDMAVALADCEGCPVTRECEQVVQPRYSWFDGVCAGRAWLDGRPVVVREIALRPSLPKPIADLYDPTSKECPQP